MSELSIPSEIVTLPTDTKDYKTLFEQPYARSFASGWWSNLKTGVPVEITPESIVSKEVLIMTELAEAVEGDRKNLMDDKLPHRCMVEVELADAAIRMLDLSYAMGITLEKLGLTKLPKKSYGEGLTFTRLVHTVCVCLFDEAATLDKYIILTHILIRWGETNGYDVVGAMVEKMEFNANRADHKIENRKTENGKKY